MKNILAASIGILAVSWLPALPSLPVFLCFLPVLLPVLMFMVLRPRLRWLACLLGGLLWGLLAGHWLLARQLPPELEGRELLLTGVLNALPESRDGYQRFSFRISEYHNLKPEYRQRLLPRQLVLSWYGQTGLRVGQEWTLKVKLSRPRGFVNRGGFDYQRWLISRGFHATGYVRPSTLNQLHPKLHYLPVEKGREAVRDWLDTRFDEETGPLLRALAIGDTSGISAEQWSVFRGTGTIHLMAISGLHIGFVAVMAFGLGKVLRAGLSILMTRLACIYFLPGLLSCLAAACYAALAGFSLPTQRSLIMVLILNLGLLVGRPGSGFNSLSWALLVVLLLDPLAGFETGFWLSFGAVACLLYCFQHRRSFTPQSGYLGIAWTWVLQTARSQWIVFLGLILPMLLLNLPLSLVSPLANLIAVPLVSFFAVAPLLPGVLLHMLGNGAGAWLVELASVALNLCMNIMTVLAHEQWSSGWYPGGGMPGITVSLAVGLGVLLLLAPRGLPARWLGLLFLLPLLLPLRSPPPPLTVTVLDVGQGLAVVVTTENRVLVYDTGPAYSERFNAGEAIVGPHLRARGLNQVDRLLVSHSHNDHAGGLLPLLAQVQVKELLTGEPLPDVGPLGAELARGDCRQKQQWAWDGVRFSLIEVPRPETGANDQSCILLVEYAGQSILIPGDIEAAVELALLEEDYLPQALTLLLAAHHGSRSSSTEPFVAHTRPHHVVYSAGYRSSYGHPHPLVLERFAAAGSQAHHVAEGGELSFIWDHRGNLKVEALRKSKRRYWFHGYPSLDWRANYL